MNDPDYLYTDGGVIGPNPSVHGLSWCFLHVTSGQVTCKRSGILTPMDLGIDRVSCNDAETIAVVRALESVPPDWSGTLFTDSMVARQRLLNGKVAGRLPDHLRGRVQSLQGRQLRIELVAGHPTTEELRQGRARRNGLPVSPFNAACDRECTRIARLYQENHL